LDRHDIREWHGVVLGFIPSWSGRIENAQWLELLRPFATVKNLHLTKQVGLCVMSALKELAAEVLPVLQNIFLEELQPSGPLQEAIGQFIAALELSGHTVTVHHWKSDF
jgi:hypothetical protein